ncbi:C40 family peptidase [Mycobacterium sp. ITM-2016-00318]|uniref:C40 family peptidase n=1 Tax=Mycobacterium sp. ITM-2016-00318 TaxID=2099693 RepID=UPI000CFA2DB8|nr:C40 family peptidase [Mycobacterium sp. ITM-2016-00318]WNG94073.1 C40 family peptidase [Mycobacterium sp. ITM-2016-00318]
MPSGLIAALAAPIREVAASVGPGWADQGDPVSSLAEVRELLADVAAATRGGWSRAAEDWSGAGADGAAEFMSTIADAADRLSLRIEELRAGAADAADAVARARFRLRDIVDRFEARAAAIEARLDEPGAAEELREEARRALGEAVAVVDDLRTELDGNAAGISTPTTPAGAPTTPAGYTPSAGFDAPAGSGAPGGFGTSGGVGTSGGSGASGGLAPTEASLAGLALPEPAEFGDGIAVTLPDGSTVSAPNPVAANAVRHALTQLGVPYVWGGTTPGVGLDCSGLTQWAYHQAGLDLPRLAQEQDLGAAVNQNALRPGDLAVWDGHVAMVVGNGQMIEAGDPVQLSSIRTTNAGQGFQGFWRPTA